MRKILLALVFAGCLQGGEPGPIGNWYSARNKTDGCFVAISFFENGGYFSDRVCPGSDSPRHGSYSVDGNIIHVTDENGPFDLEWGYEAHGDVLWIDWNGHRLDLNHEVP